MQGPVIHFPDSLRLRVPRGLIAAVQIVAMKRHQRAAEWSRQTLLRGLEADGVQFPTEVDLDPLPNSSQAE